MGKIFFYEARERESFIMKEFSMKFNLNFRLNLNFSRVITTIRGHLITHYTLSSISLDRLPFSPVSKYTGGKHEGGRRGIVIAGLQGEITITGATCST